MHASATRLLLLGTVGLTGAVLAFLIGARAGSYLDRVMTYTGRGSTAAIISR